VLLDDIGEWVDQANTWHQKRDMIVKRMLTFIDAENINKAKIVFNNSNTMIPASASTSTRQKAASDARVFSAYA